MQKRCEWLDVAKGMAIILVVLGHSAQYYLYPETFMQAPMWRIIYFFHMPFFFFLSGYASGFSNSNTLSAASVKKKATRLLLPYFV